MPDYDFTGLSSRAFEQMVQALCLKVLGTGTTIFGDGPDGGREATFEGRLSSFPSSRECWDGYVVIQAKFRQRPRNRGGEDASWALAELKKELDAFSVKASRRRKPQYYIFVTNVVLTPHRKGSKDKASELINRYKRSLHIKDSRVWDYDQICRYLDGNQEIRSAYGAWITPGDIFARIASVIDESSPDFMKVMLNFLQKELLDDHFSKLEQAGHSPEDRVPLEQVFVDLPTFPERKADPPDERDTNQTLPPGFVHEMLEISSLSLRFQDPSSRLTSEGKAHLGRRMELGRYVLIGGPGQGKSTLTQFLCQIHRANILRGRRGLEPDAKEAVKAIVQQAESQALHPGLARRFPFRIELAKFAKVLAARQESQVSSILSYIAFFVKERSGFNVSSDVLRNWLRDYPWLVILDGLDEVPASSNRSDVMEAVRDFQVDIATNEGDVLLLATTRPQGYNDEFSSAKYALVWLAPLSARRALHYGKTLVEITYKHDSQRKKEVLGRLEDAARVDATVRLMESPLQVTIMARLLAQIAKPPQERYKLFQQYYKVIYRREVERNVPILSQLLRDYEADVDAIHYHTGLLLQLESERTKHTDATLSLKEFEAVVRERLIEEGHSSEAQRELAEEIAKCATDRLVFLVPSLSNRVGFEIRSLQEFMAAEALMDGPDKVVVSRIKEIAAVPFWQNVLLFAAGKCFADRQWLRDSISAICAELNDDPEDKTGHLAQAGSRLALALLEDGPARRQPTYSHALARRAMLLLSLPASQVHDRLADVYEHQFSTVYKEEIQNALMSEQPALHLASWRLLSRLATMKNVVWAREMVERSWPSVAERQADILSVTNGTEDPWMFKQYEERFFKLPLVYNQRFAITRKLEDEKNFRNQSVRAALELYYVWPRRRRMENFRVRAHGGLLRVTLTTLDGSKKILSSFVDLKEVHPFWAPLVEACKFTMTPTKEHLSAALFQMADGVLDLTSSSYRWLFSFPWPLAVCLEAGSSGQELRLLAEKALRGELGDEKDWRAAERRWRKGGITDEDILCMRDDQWPIPSSIAEVGFPFVPGTINFPFNTTNLRELRALWEMLPGYKIKATFAEMTAFFLLEDGQDFKPSKPEHAQSDISDFIEDFISFIPEGFVTSDDTFVAIRRHLGESERAIRAIDRLGSKLKSMYESGPTSLFGRDFKLDEYLSMVLDANPSLSGVSNVLSLMAERSRIRPLSVSMRPLMYSDDRFRTKAAMALELCKSDLNPEDLLELAELVLNSSLEDEQVLWRFLKVLENNVMYRMRIDDVLQLFWDRVPPSMWRVRSYLADLMLSVLSQRVTRLQEENVWRQLGLSEGLRHVVG